jgi:tetratricopeptide (TPR) repeat protein
MPLEKTGPQPFERLTHFVMRTKMDLMRSVLYFCLMLAVLTWLPGPAFAQKRRPKVQEEEKAYVSPPAWKCVEIGDFYFKRKKYAGALSRYKEAVKVDPDYAPAYLGLGKVYEKIGLKQKALEAYRKYLDELPSAKQADEAKEAHEAIARLEKELGPAPTKAANRP